MITMDFKPEKMAVAIAYIAMRIPGATKKKISKLLYFADKRHLLEYGRTITGDDYHALPQGHVPLRGLNMMNQNTEWVSQAAIDMLLRYGRLQPDNRTFELYSEPDLKVFSRSDLRVMDEIINELGNRTPFQLERFSHQEPSWKLTPEKKRVPFELFFKGHPEAQPVKEALIEDQLQGA